MRFESPKMPSPENRSKPADKEAKKKPWSKELPSPQELIDALKNADKYGFLNSIETIDAINKLLPDDIKNKYKEYFDKSNNVNRDESNKENYSDVNLLAEKLNLISAMETEKIFIGDKERESNSNISEILNEYRSAIIGAFNDDFGSVFSLELKNINKTKDDSVEIELYNMEGLPRSSRWEINIKIKLIKKEGEWVVAESKVNKKPFFEKNKWT